MDAVNVKTRTKNPLTGEEHLQHQPYTSEITYPKSAKTVKTKRE